MDKIYWNLFPTIEYNGKKYNANTEQRLCPLIQLVLDVENKSSIVRMLLNGEGTIGKSTNLLALKIACIKNNLDFFYFNLRDINPKTLDDQGEIIKNLSNDTIIILDSHDEGRREWADSLVDIANRSRAKIVIVASRYPLSKSANGTFSDFVTATINPLNDIQINNVLVKNNISADSDVFELLHNTMFLSLYLQIKLSKFYNDGRLKNETDILREYFYKLFRGKNEDDYRCDCYLSELGQLLFRQCCEYSGIFSVEEKTKIEEIKIPAPLKKIFTIDNEELGFSETFLESMPSSMRTFIESPQFDELHSKRFEMHATHVQFLNYVIAVYLVDYMKDKSLQDETQIMHMLIQAEQACGYGYCSEEIFYYIGQILASTSNTILYDIALNNRTMLTAKPMWEEGIGSLKEENTKLPLRKIFLLTLFGFGCECLLDRHALYPHFIEFVDFDDFEYYYTELAVAYKYICKKLRRIESNFPLIACLSYGCTFPVLEKIEFNNEKYISKSNCLLKKLNNEGYSLILGCKNSKIPEEANYISSKAFYDCQQIKSIVIPSTINSIGEMAFSFCSNLQSIEILPSDKPLGLSVYSFANIGNSVEKLIMNRELWFDTNSKTAILKAFDKFESVKYLTLSASLLWLINMFQYTLEELYICGDCRSKGVFEEIPIKWCKSLKKLKFSSDIENIDSFSIYSNENLEQIIVEKGNKNYISSNNCLIDKRNNELICGCKNSIIPNDGSVASIGRFAFYRCKNLGPTVHVPEGIKFIGSNAFGGCECLETVYLPSTLEDVEGFIFSSCPNLKRIFLPKECNNSDYVLFKRLHWYNKLIEFI